MIRKRLPNRRLAVTEEVGVGAMRLTATIGFDPEGRPVEVFLSGAKDGSGLAAILEDAAVVISVALQHAVPAAVLGKSIARQPESLDGPAIAAASPIGAALDLVSRYEWRYSHLSPKRDGDMTDEIDAAIRKAVTRQIKFDNGVIEILGLMAKHLAVRNALDLEALRVAIEQRSAVLETPTDEYPKGLNPDHAMALRSFLGAIAETPPASPQRTVN